MHFLWVAYLEMTPLTLMLKISKFNHNDWCTCPCHDAREKQSSLNSMHISNWWCYGGQYCGSQCNVFLNIIKVNSIDGSGTKPQADHATGIWLSGLIPYLNMYAHLITNFVCANSLTYTPLTTRFPSLVVNHLVLNLKSYSFQHHGLPISDNSSASEVKSHYSKVLGNIGAPLDFNQGIDSFMEDELPSSSTHGEFK